MPIRRLIIVLLAAMLPLQATAQETAATGSVSQQEVVRATLLSEYDAIKPGEPVTLGVLLEPRDGWHTYWENPGDAGMPTSFTWTLPEGFSASAIHWPAPERIREGDLVVHSYHASVLLPVTITPPAVLDPTQHYRFHVKATWLVCMNICIPESAELELSLPVTGDAPSPSASAPLFATHRATSPKPISRPASFSMDNELVTIALPLSDLGITQLRNAVFFPRQYNAYTYASEQQFNTNNDLLNLYIPRSNDLPADNSSGILTITLPDGGMRHFDITLKASAAAPEAALTPLLPNNTAPSQPQENTKSFFSYLLLAIAGGIILNLMPCVLPVLSLKTLAIAKKAGAEPIKVRKLGLAYTVGILWSFAIIAGTLIALRQGGEAIGWGYQMQSPAFVGFLVYLLFLVGLNLSGVFELPVLFGSKAAGTDDSTVAGSFWTGVLATAVATPCTAPFMAAAVGAALTMPAMQSLLVFEALGLGLALPFLLVSFFPALLRFLPKPGAWMERFRQFLAFPMYASVIWLLWVLTLQAGAMGAVIAMGGMLALVMVIWIGSFFDIQSTAYRILALVLGFGILAASLPALQHMDGMPASPGMPGDAGISETAFSPEILARLRKDGTPVFLNATAAWCLTCQLNAKVAIHTSATTQLFKDKGITYMVADWTRANPDITELLGNFGHKGVPMYVYYPPGKGTPQLLPQLLTEDIIRTAISQ